MFWVPRGKVLLSRPMVSQGDILVNLPSLGGPVFGDASLVTSEPVAHKAVWLEVLEGFDFCVIPLRVLRRYVTEVEAKRAKSKTASMQMPGLDLGRFSITLPFPEVYKVYATFFKAPRQSHWFWQVVHKSGPAQTRTFSLEPRTGRSFMLSNFP